MITQINDDVLAFSYGEGDLMNSSAENHDGQIEQNYKHYLGAADADTKAIKKAFFAVIIHGWVDSVAPAASNNSKKASHWDLSMLASEILHVWRKRGKNRAILLLSCFTGNAFAHPLAMHHLKLPVIAPRSTAIVGPSGNIYVREASLKERNFPDNETQIYNVGNNLDWVFCQTNGNITIFPYSTLDKTAAVKFAKANPVPWWRA